MHPLQSFLEAVKASSSSREEFHAKQARLAEQVGVKASMFHRIVNPNQRVNLSEAKALRLELATNGLVRAESANEHIGEIITLAKQVIEQRKRSRAPKTTRGE